MTCPNTGCGFLADGPDLKHCPRCGSFLPPPEADPTDPLLGQPILGGKFRILSVLGEGGMGKVYLGEQKLGSAVRKVAIKTLQPDLAQDPQIVARFHQETRTVIQLEHPNTIKFYDFGELADGKLFVAMEYLQGESLAHVIARGPLPPQRVEHILQQVCGSLAEAHEHGIVHRDLKPENIILTQKGARGDFVKVLDFGIAKRSEADDAQNAKLTRQGMVLGTPPYMSPEQFTGQALKATSDIYSLAIMTYEMLTGKLPYTASTPWEWATKHLTGQPTPFEMQPNGAAILPRHKSAVMRALARNTNERPQTTTAFLQEFTGDANAGGDWAQPTSGVSSSNYNQGQQTPQPFNQQSQPQMYGGQGSGPTGMAPQQGMQTPGGQPMVHATVASGPYASVPQNFGGPGVGGFPPSNPNFPQGVGGPGMVPAPSNAGFQAVNAPPSNPGFNNAQQYAPQAMGYPPQGMGLAPQSYHPAQMQPKSGGMGKFIAIGVVLVLVGGGVAAAFAFGGDNGNANNTATTTQTNTPQLPANNVPQPYPNQNNNVIQPIPPPINNAVVMRPIDNPNAPIAPPIAPQPQPMQPRPAVHQGVCQGGAGRIDNLILDGHCQAAQALFRQMRAAGCAGRASDSFGTACPAP